MRVSLPWLCLLVALGLPLPGGLTMPLPALAQTVPNEAQSAEADRLLELGRQQYRVSQWREALQSWQAALEIYRAIGDHSGEGASLGHLGNVYYRLGQYPEAINFHHQHLDIAREMRDRIEEGRALGNLGLVYYRLGQYPEAINFHQQSLTIFREINDRIREGSTLGNLGLVDSSRGQYSQAIDFHQQHLSIAHEIGDRAGEGRALGNLGNAYYRLGQYLRAIDFYQQRLSIAHDLGDRLGEANALNGLGLVSSSLGQYPQAIDLYQQHLAIAREIGDRAGEGAALSNLGLVYSNMGQYFQALDFHQQSLAVLQEIGARATEAIALGNIGIIYEKLGNYSQALAMYQQSLAIKRDIGDRATESVTLVNIGIIYEKLGNYPQALETYQQSLAISQEIGDRAGEAQTLMGMGNIYQLQGNYGEALATYQQSLTISRDLGDRATEAITLMGIGNIYRLQENYGEALATYQQSLTISRDLGDRATEAQTLLNIGTLWNAQGETALAIVFLKASVNVYEGIRQSNQSLEQSLKDSYLTTIEDTYRGLADLLIQQGRLAEAQRVLELLKVQELQDFTRSATLTKTQGSIPLLAQERDILALFYASLMELARALYDCEQTQCSQLSALRNQLDEQTLVFNGQVATFRADLQKQFAQDPGLLSADRLSDTAREIVTAQPGTGTVLVYPLVLEDRVRLLIAVRAGENGVALRAVEAAVDKETLWRTVNQFRGLLDTPDSDLEAVQATAAQLYDWLIAPLEQELSAPEIDHLVFALDRSTRYVPMGALFDARTQQYLVEKYAVSTILGADLTDMNDRLSSDVQRNPVLGLGLSTAVEGFSPLRYVPQEVNAIVRTNEPNSQGLYPGRVLIDEDFTYTNLRDALAGNRVLHIATHAKFELGLPQNSFLLGSEGKITIDRIQLLGNYGLDDVHLVVLSACETAVGGPDDNGIEIPGISYYLLGGGASSVMASLWLVNDSSTSLLMQRFYTLLATGELTKAEALRQAQLSLLKGEATLDERIASLGISRGFELAAPEESSVVLAHPYYWAPFILIGNGL